jgi:hypothetical protein
VPLSASASDNTSGAFGPPSAQITVNQAGLYLIQYSVNLAAGSFGVYQLFRNTTTALPNTVGSTENSLAGGHMLVGATVIRLSATDTIGIKNIGTTADTFQNTTDGATTTPTSATLTMVRLGS